MVKEVFLLLFYLLLSLYIFDIISLELICVFFGSSGLDVWDVKTAIVFGYSNCGGPNSRRRVDLSTCSSPPPDWSPSLLLTSDLSPNTDRASLWNTSTN